MSEATVKQHPSGRITICGMLLEPQEVRALIEKLNKMLDNQQQPQPASESMTGPAPREIGER